MNKISFKSKIVANGEHYNAIRGTTGANKDKVDRKIASDLKKLNCVLRETNQVFSSIVKYGQTFFFDYTFAQIEIYKHLRDTVYERIEFVSMRYSGNNPEFYKNTIFNIINNVSNLVAFVAVSCKKIKYTGFEYEIQTLQYALDRIMFDLRKICLGSKIVEMDNGNYERMYNSDFQYNMINKNIIPCK